MVTKSRKLPTNNSDSVSLEIEVLRGFRIVFNSVKAHFKNVEKISGLGGAQLWALSVVANNPDIVVGQLAASMDIHQTTASNILKSLIDAGHIEAIRTPTDRRKISLRVGPLGIKVLKSAPEPFTGVLPDALARLDRSTLLRLRKDLNALNKALSADKSGAKVPLANM